MYEAQPSVEDEVQLSVTEPRHRFKDCKESVSCSFNWFFSFCSCFLSAFGYFYQLDFFFLTFASLCGVCHNEVKKKPENFIWKGKTKLRFIFIRTVFFKEELAGLVNVVLVNGPSIKQQHSFFSELSGDQPELCWPCKTNTSVQCLPGFRLCPPFTELSVMSLWFLNVGASNMQCVCVCVCVCECFCLLISWNVQ